MLFSLKWHRLLIPEFHHLKIIITLRCTLLCPKTAFKRSQQLFWLGFRGLYQFSIKIGKLLPINCHLVPLIPQYNWYLN